MRVDFCDTKIRSWIFVYRMMPVVAVSVMDLFVIEKNVMTPIKFISQSLPG